jgi:hypothetical protein
MLDKTVKKLDITMPDFVSPFGPVAAFEGVQTMGMRCSTDVSHGKGGRELLKQCRVTDLKTTQS